MIANRKSHQLQLQLQLGSADFNLCDTIPGYSTTTKWVPIANVSNDPCLVHDAFSEKLEVNLDEMVLVLYDMVPKPAAAMLFLSIQDRPKLFFCSALLCCGWVEYTAAAIEI